jgi:hypothetical protein
MSQLHRHDESDTAAEDKQREPELSAARIMVREHHQRHTDNGARSRDPFHAARE